MQRKEIKGERFGRLVAVEKRGSGKWLFLCDYVPHTLEKGV